MGPQNSSIHDVKPKLINVKYMEDQEPLQTEVQNLLSHASQTIKAEENLKQITINNNINITQIHNMSNQQVPQSATLPMQKQSLGSNNTANNIIQ